MAWIYREDFEVEWNKRSGCYEVVDRSCNDIVSAAFKQKKDANEFAGLLEAETWGVFDYNLASAPDSLTFSYLKRIDELEEKSEY